MSIEEITAAGFPVAVATFLLIRLERELRALRQVIEHCWLCQACRDAMADANRRVLGYEHKSDS